MMAVSRITSPSTGGLPRESRISRAVTLSMIACRAIVMGRISIVGGPGTLERRANLPRVLAGSLGRWDTGHLHEAEPSCHRTLAYPHAAPDLRLSGPLRRRSGARQAHGGHRRLQPPQALRSEGQRAETPDQ